MPFVSSLLLLIAADGAAQAAITNVVATDETPPNARAMSRSEIRAYNAKRSATDPNYIRCRKEVRSGSLVAATFICHTNSQWAAKDELNNSATREVLDRMQGQGHMNGN